MTLSRFTTGISRAALVVLAVGMLAACGGSDGPTLNTAPALAYVRVVNAIPDTGLILYRFTDKLENALDANGTAFRTASAYQGYAPGDRTFRAFMLNAAASAAIAGGAPLIDQQVTLNANTYYTIVHFGRAIPATADSIAVIVDSIPTPSVLAANIAVRALHFATGVSGVDVLTTRRAGDALPATPAFAGLAYRASTGNTYTIRTAADSIAARVRVVAAPAVVLTAQGPNGEAGTDQRNPLSGVRIGGTALSVIAFPSPTAATRATAADTLPVIRWFVDGRAFGTQPIDRS
jgi:hypothetical protein